MVFRYTCIPTALMGEEIHMEPEKKKNTLHGFVEAPIVFQIPVWSMMFTRFHDARCGSRNVGEIFRCLDLGLDLFCQKSRTGPGISRTSRDCFEQGSPTLWGSERFGGQMPLKISEAST